MLLISSLYFPLNRFLTTGFTPKTALDAYIPLIPIFAIPYLLFIPYWIAAFLFAALKMDDQLFRAFMIGSISAGTVATLIFFVFPTYVNRPSIHTSGWTASLLNILYSSDNVFNAFPSEHVLYTTLIALFGSTWRPKWRFFFFGSVVLVILSTLLTGQHYLVDPIGGLVLGWVGYRFGLWVEYRQLKISRLFSTELWQANTKRE